MKKILIVMLTITLIAASLAWAQTLKSPGGESGLMRTQSNRLDHTQIKGEATNTLLTNAPVTGAGTSVDIGAPVADHSCYGWLSNGASNSAAVDIEVSIDNSIFYKVQALTITGTAVSAIRNTAGPAARYIRGNPTNISNATAPVSVKCTSRTDW